jgi:Raf kinase inhibitor-like YbhB/YbcL family protein
LTARKQSRIVSRAGIAAATALLALLAGCGGEKVEGPPPAAPQRIKLTSPAFAPGATIPKRFSCDGKGVSPPLAWRGVPADARWLALLVEDPDAPGGTFVHWTLFDIPTEVRRLRAGESPAGARSGDNSFGDRGYGGPCPPEGDAPHRYRFVIYALRDELGLDAGASPQDVRAAIGERALARGELTGRFGR